MTYHHEQTCARCMSPFTGPLRTVRHEGRDVTCCPACLTEAEAASFAAAHDASQDNDRGLYDKYTVTRLDGRDRPGEKHDGCRYFVLDVTHDPYAPAALRAYVEACRAERPALAADLMALGALGAQEGET